MPLFHQNTGNISEQIQNLLIRIVKLYQAVSKQKITPEILRGIATLSTEQLEEAFKKTPPDDKNLVTLCEIITIEENEEITVNSSEEFNECLRDFDKNHGDYLDLIPLAVSNSKNIQPYLNHLATFYDVFIQFITLVTEEDTTTIGINQNSVTQRCEEWKRTRPSQVHYNPNQRSLTLAKKFINRTLKSNEWLLDLDILDAFRFLGLDKQGTHISTKDARSIAAQLSMERKRHLQDNPQRPYVIPLVINDSEKLSQAGIHWTYALVQVNPSGSDTQINVIYRDSLTLINTNKTSIEKIIRAALKFQENGDTAFPNCKNPSIDAQGTQEQQDGWSCGYRALHGLVRFLVYEYPDDFLGTITDSQKKYIEQFRRCESSNEIRDFIYNLLICEQPLPPESVTQNDDRIESRDENRYVKQTSLDEFLNRYSFTPPKKTLDIKLLINQFEDPNTTPITILQLITDTRKTLLTKSSQQIPTQHKLATTIGGWYSLLTDFELKAYEKLSATEKDPAIKYKFNDIKTVLTCFTSYNLYRTTLPKIIDQLNSEALLTEDSQPNLDEVLRQYRVITEFFTRIIINLKQEKLNPDNEEDENLRVLLRYAEEKQIDLVNYFNQCEQLQCINQHPPILLFRAIGTAAAALVSHWLEKEPSTPIPCNTFTYKEKIIPITNSAASIDLPTTFIIKKSVSFFKTIKEISPVKMHSVYRFLLEKIEEEILKTEQGEVEFQSITLESSKSSTIPLLKLTIGLTLNSTSKTIIYTIIPETGKLARIECNEATMAHSASRSLAGSP